MNEIYLIVKHKTRKIAGAVISWFIIFGGGRNRSLRFLDRHRCVICAVAHNPTRRLMRRIVKWFLLRRFTFVSQADVLAAIKGEICLPHRSIWLIFDDGCKNILSHVIPILKKHYIPFTIAVSPAETETGNAWPRLSKEKGKAENRFDKMAFLPNDQRKEKCAQLKTRVKNSARPTLLSIEEIKDLSKDPLITIENHTNSHAICTRCTPDEFREEVITANKQIKAWTGRMPVMLLYPFGAWSAELDDQLPSCQLSASANSGNIFLDLDRHYSLFAIPRIALLDDISLTEETCRLLRTWIRWTRHSKMRK